jgi:hypothetical protein
MIFATGVPYTLSGIVFEDAVRLYVRSCLLRILFSFLEERQDDIYGLMVAFGTVTER